MHHTLDVLASNVILGEITNGSGGNELYAQIYFDQGTFDATKIVMANKTSGTGTMRAIFDVGDAGNLIVNSAAGPGGGAFTIASNSVAGGSADGSLSILGGTASINTDILIGATTGTATATITVQGGTLDMMNHNIGTSIPLSSKGQITLTAIRGTIKNLAQLNGGGALNKSGTSTDILILDGLETYTGPTSVDAGTLLVNGSHTGGGSYTVASGATLGGTGSTTSAVTVNSGGFVAPGASIESLDLGSTTLNGTLEIELNDSDANVVDVLNVNGAFNISSATSKLDFNITGTPGLPAYEFASYGSLVGTQFATVSDVPSGYTIDYHYNDGTDSNNIALVTVPEPSTLVLAILGTASICFFVRRRRLRI